MIKSRIDYYILIIVISILIFWFQFTTYNINKSTSDKLKSEVDSLKVETKILTEKTKRDYTFVQIFGKEYKIIKIINNFFKILNKKI